MGLKPTSVSLYGRTFPATSWKGVLLTVCEVVREKHPKEFNRVLSLRGRSRSYFSTDPGQLFKSAEVPGSNIHAETNLSANDIARRCQEVLELVGDDPATLQITAV